MDGSGGTTRYVPRSVQVDLEAGVCNKVRLPIATLSLSDTVHEAPQRGSRKPLSP